MGRLQQQSRRQTLIVIAVLAVLAPNLARAGLVSAILTSLDGLEQLDRTSHEFIAAQLGNDVDGRELSGPTLYYSPSTGDLSANIPAAILTFAPVLIPSQPPLMLGQSPPVKLYSISVIELDMSSFIQFTSVQTSAFTWGIGMVTRPDPLQEIAAVADEADADGRFTWRPVFNGATPFNGKTTAATIDFGPVLPAGLLKSDLASTFSPEGTLNSFVEYANHRDVVTLTVPFSVSFVPEPITMIYVLSVVLISAICIRRPRTKFTCCP